MGVAPPIHADSPDPPPRAGAAPATGAACLGSSLPAAGGEAAPATGRPKPKKEIWPGAAGLEQARSAATVNGQGALCNSAEAATGGSAAAGGEAGTPLAIVSATYSAPPSPQ